MLHRRFGASRLLFCALLLFLALSYRAVAEEGAVLLTAPAPVPNQALLEAVINTI